MANAKMNIRHLKANLFLLQGKGRDSTGTSMAGKITNQTDVDGRKLTPHPGTLGLFGWSNFWMLFRAGYVPLKSTNRSTISSI